jgi:CRP-like cAMP-binding protein
MVDTGKRLFAESHTDPQKPSKPPQSGFETVRYDAHKVIFEEGEPGDAAYLIMHGKVEIRKGMKSSNPQTLAVLSKNDIFGEMALFDDSPRMAEAIARTKVELIAIKRDEFNRRLETIDPVFKTISLYLVGRVRYMANEFMKRKDPNWGHWKNTK